MTALRRLFRLSVAERRLLVGCVCSLAAMRVGLSVISLRMLHALVTRCAHSSKGTGLRDRPSVDRIAWAVRAASRFVPGGTCLPQALAAEFMLIRHGYPAQLRIGMARMADALEGHAWVECNGAVVVGGGDVGRYTALPVLDGNRGAAG